MIKSLIFLLLLAGMATVVYATTATLTITLISPTPENDIYTIGSFIPNVSTGNNATNCSLFFNNTYTDYYTTIASVTNRNNTFTNETEISFVENVYGDPWQNMTAKCWNGTYYWLNTSATAGFYNFKIDNTVPAFVSQLANVVNYTGYGNKLRLRFNVTDENIQLAYLRIYYPDGTTVVERNVTNITTGTGSSTKFFEYNVTYSDLTQNGIYTFEPKAVDMAGVYASGTNWTFAAMNLKTSEWNPVTLFQNLTLRTIASISENITYVTIYHNNASKNFITFQNGLSTNGGTTISETLNTTLIYPTVNITIIYPANTST
jgi:hypothetical protein